MVGLGRGSRYARGGTIGLDPCSTKPHHFEYPLEGCIADSFRACRDGILCPQRVPRPSLMVFMEEEGHGGVEDVLAPLIEGVRVCVILDVPADSQDVGVTKLVRSAGFHCTQATDLQPCPSQQGDREGWTESAMLIELYIYIYVR